MENPKNKKIGQEEFSSQELPPLNEAVIYGVASTTRIKQKSLQSNIYKYTTTGWSLDNDGQIVANNLKKNKVFKYMKNSSGGALAAGDVVVYDATSTTGDEVTTTTTQGDDFICGMVVETVADTDVALILVEGTTTDLKVNGTTAIAVGDMLGTYTSAGISMKAASGDMAYAIALEAYSTADSAGVIDALLISPRKI